MRSILRVAAAVLALYSLSLAQTSTPIDPSMYSGLRWRLLGPLRAGRVTSVSGAPSDPAVYYIGTPDGGVWKTSDGGRVWEPTMDTVPVSSIGSVAVSPSNPNVVYAGTGEESPGQGMYKSTDAGKTWAYAGMKETKYIVGIVVDPRNPDVVTIAASGTFDPTPDRGIYRTTDGGRSWKKVLFIDNNWGPVDITAAPDNPKLMLAALLRHPNTPPQQQPIPMQGDDPAKVGADAVVYKSTDGGSSWKPAGTNGFPTSRLGRLGVAIAPGGQRMFAIVNQGLFRSDDGGNSWKKITEDTRIIGASYFSKVFVNPKNANEVYVAQTAMYRSRDGGATFTGWNGAPSGDDVHTLWINPADPRHMILGIDQGAIISMDAGNTWTEWFNQATGQFYHVTTDNQFPYHAFAAQQDSGSIATVSRSDYGEITYRDWISPAAFEVAHILADPVDPDIIYGSGWYSTLIRFSRKTGQYAHVFVPGTQYRSATAPPIAFLPHSPNTLLLGADKVLETTDKGQTWRAISPELGGVPANQQQQGRERGGRSVVTAIAPSPQQDAVIWAGSSDGLIHVTRDSGGSWENVSLTKENSDLVIQNAPQAAGMPASVSTFAGVACIDAGHFDPGTAYVVFQAFRNPTPMIVRTHDYGQHWNSIVKGLPAGTAWAVREDPVRKGLLYAAVDHGVFVSFDDGDSWQPLQLNLPMTVMRDIAVHENDLLVATYGRALWVIDDVSPLRQLGPEVANSASYLFKPSTAIRVRWDVNNDTPLPPETPAAPNPPDGAILDYYLKTQPHDITLEIHDAKGLLVRRFTTTPAPEPAQPPNAPDYWFRSEPSLKTSTGLNRFVWDLRYEHPPLLTYGYFGAHLDYFEYTLPDHAIPGETPRWQPQGPLAPPGRYEVVLTVDGQTYRQPLEIKPDPRVKVSDAEFAAQLALEQRLGRGMAASYDAWNQAHAARTALNGQKEKLGANAPKAAADAIAALDKQLDVFENGARGQNGFGPLNRDIGRLVTMAGTADGAPSQTLAQAAMAECGELDKVLASWRDLNTKEIAAFNSAAAQNGTTALPVATNIPVGCGQ